MKDYRDGIRQYEDAAEERYDNFDGEEYEDGDDNFDPGFEGNEDAYYDEDYEDGAQEDEYEYEYVDTDSGGEYDNYSANSIGRIDPNDRTLTIVVTNSGANDQEVYLFAGNRELPQHADISVVVEESSHKEVQNESMSSPFKINGLKLSVSNPLQLDQVLHIVHRSSTGSNTSRVYQPRNATSPQNLNPNMIDDANFGMEVSGQDGINFTQKAGITSVFTMTINARTNMKNVLKGRNVAEMATAPRTMGLPQYDMLYAQKNQPFGLKSKGQARKVIRRNITKSPGAAMRSVSRRTGRRPATVGRFLRRRASR